MKPLLLPLLALAVLAGCESVTPPAPTARGNGEEIIVATDSATWAGPVGEALRETLGQPIATLPSNQGAFRVRFQPLTNRFFEALKIQPNLVFAAPIDAEGPIGDFLRSRVGEQNLASVRAGQAAAINLRDDLWAREQLVTVATAASDSLLASQIRARGPELRRRYQELARRRTGTEMFSRLRQTDIEADLFERHGFAVGIQHDYVPVQDTTVTVAGRTGTFVRFRRVLSDTWRDFFVFQQDGVAALPPEDEMDDVTNALLETFARGSYDGSFVQIDDERPMTRDTTSVGGRPAREQRGFWYMTEDVMGGSYVRYTIVDEATDRLFVYYGMTFAPDRTLDKRKLLRQMEAIAFTLQTEPTPDD